MQSETKQEPITWETEILRFTGFPLPSVDITQATWWTELFDQPPDTEIFKSKVNTKHIEGELDNSKLILELSPQRLDLLLTVNDQRSPIISQNSIGVFSNKLTEFSDLIFRWFALGSIPDFHRLAFGGVLILPVKDKATGYQIIGNFLQYVQIDPGSSDFLYQINRPRLSRSNIPNLYINRLSKWSVAKSIQIQIAPNIRIEAGLEEFACRLEFDINTSAEFNEEINPEQSRLIFLELVDLAIEISQNGDIP